MTDRMYSVFLVQPIRWHVVSHRFRDKTQKSMVGFDLGRQVEFPFLPLKGLSLDALSLRDPEEDSTAVIEDVAWNIQNQRFTVAIKPDVILRHVAAIPQWLETALAGGWVIRSMEGPFTKPDGSRPMPSSYPKWARSDLGSVQATKRPKDFNEFVKAITRHMADDLASQAVAYAIDRTGWIFWTRPNDNNQDSRWLRWIKAMRAFEDMTGHDYTEWREKLDTYPELRDVVLPLLQDDEDDDDDDDTSSPLATKRRIPPPPPPRQRPLSEA